MTSILDSTAFGLDHVMFLIDADLAYKLDEKSMHSFTSQFVNEIMDVLSMKPLGELGIFPATDQKAPGWSFIQPITTSHISGHYFAGPGKYPHMHLDIYSCKKFDWMLVLQVFSKYFPLREWSANVVGRGWGHEKRNYLEILGNMKKVTKTSTLTIESAN